MKTAPKYVRKAKMFCVTFFSNEKVKGNEKRLQKIEWFNTFEEANQFYAA